MRVTTYRSVFVEVCFFYIYGYNSVYPIKDVFSIICFVRRMRQV